MTIRWLNAISHSAKRPTVFSNIPILFYILFTALLYIVLRLYIASVNFLIESFMTLLLSICYLACSAVEYSMINRFVAACFKNLLLDACMLTSPGNILLYPSCTKLLRMQVYREFYRSQAGLNLCTPELTTTCSIC